MDSNHLPLDVSQTHYPCAKGAFVVYSPTLSVRFIRPHPVHAIDVYIATFCWFLRKQDVNPYVTSNQSLVYPRGSIRTCTPPPGLEILLSALVLSSDRQPLYVTLFVINS